MQDCQVRLTQPLLSCHKKIQYFSESRLPPQFSFDREKRRITEHKWHFQLSVERHKALPKQRLLLKEKRDSVLNRELSNRFENVDRNKEMTYTSQEWLSWSQKKAILQFSRSWVDCSIFKTIACCYKEIQYFWAELYTLICHFTKKTLVQLLNTKSQSDIHIAQTIHLGM